MKPFVMPITLTAACIYIGSTADHVYANSAQYAPPSATAPKTIEVLNNAEGVASYVATSRNEAAEKMQSIHPAAGGGLTNRQLENWELHRLQRFYNSDHGVTK